MQQDYRNRLPVQQRPPRGNVLAQFAHGTYDRDLRMYKTGPLEPIAMPGDLIVLNVRELFILYMISFVEPLSLSGALVVNGGAVGANATLPTLATTNILDMNYGNLAIFRFHVLDDIAVEVRQPASVSRHGKRVGLTEIGMFTHLNFPNDEPSEMAVFEDQLPNLGIRNPRPLALTQSRVAFYGHKYVLYGENGSEGASVGNHLKPLDTFTSIAEVVEAGYANVPTIPIGAWGS